MLQIVIMAVKNRAETSSGDGGGGAINGESYIVRNRGVLRGKEESKMECEEGN